MTGEPTHIWVATRAIAHARRTGSCLVALRAEGSKQPLFVLPGRAALVGAYARYLPYIPDRPVYAFEPAGADGTTTPDASVADMASRLLVELRRVQPEGPYHFFGHCAGGVVAVDVARRLHADGHRVGALVLADAWNPRHAKWRLAIRRYRKALRNHPGVLASVGFSARWGFRAVRWAVVHPLRKPFRMAGRPLPKWLGYKGVGTAMRDANDYRPKPYAGSVTLVRSNDLAPGGGVGPDLGWGSIASGGVEVHTVGDDHGDFTNDEETIQATATVIQQALDAAELSLG